MKRKIFIGWFIFLFVFPIIVRAQEFALTDSIPEAKIWGLLEKVKNVNFANSDEVIIFDHMKGSFNEQGMFHSNNHLLVKILTEKGARNRSTFTLGYDPLSNLVRVERVRVFKKNHKIVGIPIKTVKDVPQPGGIIFWGSREKVLDIPDLEVGDAIEYCVAREGFKIAYLLDKFYPKFSPPMKGHYFDKIYFQSGTPILEKVYTLIGPKDKPLQQGFFNAKLQYSCKFKDNHIIYVWKDKNIKPFKGEPNMVSFSDVAPKLVFATVPSWKYKSQWLYKVAEPSFKVDKAIKEKVAKLIKGKKTDEEKMKALFYWSANEVRYLGLSMGKGEGYTPHPAIETFHQLAGVCKDKAMLLAAMLRVAGFQAYFVSTEVGSRVEDIPADQFNHGIVAVKNSDGSYLILDPTIGANGQEFLPSYEARQAIVIGTPKGENLRLTRYFRPDESSLNVKMNGKLSAAGSLNASLLVSMTGYYDWQMRRVINRMPKYQWNSLFLKWLKDVYPTAKMKKIKFSNPTDYYTSTKINIVFSIPNFAISNGQHIFIHYPLSLRLFRSNRWNDFLNAANLKIRKFPLRLASTRSFSSNEKIALPKGYEIELKPKEINDKNDVIAVNSHYFLKNGKNLSFTMKLDLKKKKIMPKLYPDFRKVVNGLNEMTTKEWLILSK